MAGQENFKAVIKDYLDNRAKTDKQFAKSYKKKGKSLDECCNYIIGEVQKKAKSGIITTSWPLRLSSPAMIDGWSSVSAFSMTAWDSDMNFPNNPI